MTASSARQTILITGADSNYFPLMSDAISSFRSFPQSHDVALGVLDFGLDEEQRRWIMEKGGQIVAPEILMSVPDHLRGKRYLGYLARPFLREYFPGHRRYIWLDADAWMQTWDVIDALIPGADECGLAAAHESDPGYSFDARLTAWNTKHYLLGYGPVVGARLMLRRRRVNNGVFCLLGDAPHWDRWRTAMSKAVHVTGRAIPHDQFALNRVLFVDGLPVRLLAPPNNWICSRGVPRWDSKRKAFCTPNREAATISVMHLAGHRAKNGGMFDVRTTAGGVLKTGLRYGQRPQDDAHG